MTKRNKSAQWIEGISGHSFSDVALLHSALTHSSLAGEESFERLEFLGDRVLGLVIAQMVFEEFPEDPEGKLATRFTSLVRRETLAEIARAIDLGSHIRMAHSARSEGTQNKDSVLADCCEALIGALYCDGGFEVAERFIKAKWEEQVKARPKIRKDAKTRLQEWAQGHGLPLPLYQEEGRSGPDHQPQFIISVTVEGCEPVEAMGLSKRDAQQKAATKLLKVVAQK